MNKYQDVPNVELAMCYSPRFKKTTTIITTKTSRPSGKAGFFVKVD